MKKMAEEMGEGRYYPDLCRRMAQYELTLLDWAEQHKGAREYVVFADKCWPAFPEQFGFEPCYVNSRLAAKGIPVACEVDIYGALSEYIGACISDDAVTLLDINNSVPKYIYDEDIAGKYNYRLTDLFMGFHCGNTPSCKMCDDRAIKYQLIQHRLLEPEGSDPDFTRGTLEGDIAASDITFYRLQCDSEGVLRSYIAQGEVLPVKTRSFGGIGIFADSGDGTILPSCTDPEEISSSRSGCFRSLWQGTVRCLPLSWRGGYRLQSAGLSALPDRESVGLIQRKEILTKGVPLEPLF